jgi:hypothetical protein
MRRPGAEDPAVDSCPAGRIRIWHPVCFLADMAHVVESNTPDVLNRRIHRRTVAHVQQALAGGRAEIERRLEELEREWSIERALQSMAATLSLTGIGLAVAVERRWLILPGVVLGFLLQHAIQGWCPPLPLLRALGYRTDREIETERQALKAARGDFDAMEVARAAGPNTLLTIAEL